MRNSILDPPAIMLGFGSYLAISGWLFIPPLAFLLSILYGGALGGITRGIVGLLAFAASGYVAGRVALASPVANAAAVGVAIYAFIAVFNYGMEVIFGNMATIELVGQVGRLLRGVASAAVGGLAARWDMQRRSVGRISVASLSRRARTTVVALALAPWLLLLLLYRPS